MTHRPVDVYVAALLAWHLKEFGETTLSDLYQASAELPYSYHTTILAQTHEADYHNDARLLSIRGASSAHKCQSTDILGAPYAHPAPTSSNGKQWVASGLPMAS